MASTIADRRQHSWWVRRARPQASLVAPTVLVLVGVVADLRDQALGSRAHLCPCRWGRRATQDTHRISRRRRRLEGRDVSRPIRVGERAEPAGDARDEPPHPAVRWKSLLLRSRATQPHEHVELHEARAHHGDRGLRLDDLAQDPLDFGNGVVSAPRPRSRRSRSAQSARHPIRSV